MAAELHLFAVSDSAPKNLKLISLKWLHDEQNCDVQKHTQFILLEPKYSS
jgi:hypothetical protein